MSRGDRIATPGDGPLEGLPRLSSTQARLTERLARGESNPAVSQLTTWLRGALGLALQGGPPEVRWRGSGLRRAGVVADLTWQRQATRIGLGMETTLAHALVDRLLGFDHRAEAARLQVTPVEWGIITYVLAQALEMLVDRSRGAWDLVIDRVSPEPFSYEELGRLVTLRWTARVGATAGSIRLWLPEFVVLRELANPPRPVVPSDDWRRGRFADLAADWVADAGTVTLPRGTEQLRPGGVLPIDGGTLRGTVEEPVGPLLLTARDRQGAYRLPAEPAPHSSAGRVIVHPPLRRYPLPREPRPLSILRDPTSSSTPPTGPTDVPVTLTVELGRVTLPLARLADLKPGDVIELGRHPREPVELTSQGKLVARGELVQIDTELGVRVTNVLL